MPVRSSSIQSLMAYRAVLAVQFTRKSKTLRYPSKLVARRKLLDASISNAVIDSSAS